MDAFKHKELVRKIKEWASIHLREYPWRKDPTEYQVLISEILLQRTKASQVVSVYHAFFSRFPTVSDFKRAKKDEIVTIIKSLGLLKRADYLIMIANRLKDDKKEITSLSELEVLSLPGIGKYSLNAFLCFGRNQRVPILDTNIIRIYHRYFGYKSPKKIPRNDKELWDFADKILPRYDYKIFNYALIDFGNLVCIPRNPNCDICPLNLECTYFQSINEI